MLILLLGSEGGNIGFIATFFSADVCAGLGSKNLADSSGHCQTCDREYFTLLDCAVARMVAGFLPISAGAGVEAGCRSGGVLA
jgi:hypothetical protein